MSAPSGIEVDDELRDTFSTAVETKQTRFIKVSIENEALVHKLSIPIRGSLQEDLLLLDSEDILQDNTPAYLLTKLDDPPAEWLVIYYVPDTAKVREKSLGSAVFSDSIFATSNQTSPQKRMLPTANIEREMADVRAAERQAGGLSAYQGSRARTTHIGQTIGMAWAEDLQEAVKGLSEGDDSVLVVLTIDMASETLALHSSATIEADQVGSALPGDGACYAFFAWKHAPSRRDIVFIYSCPSGSPVKQRMVYASGFNAVFMAGKTLLEGSLSPLNTRKIETSVPAEINEAYLRSELDLNATTPGSGTQTPSAVPEENKPFARPRGPKRR
ncbi:actin depolymerizing protein [Mycena amicta]|nr:actin depolymerizing protein [Mycena amicta]